MEKKKTYINKNCEWCLKNWYNGKEYITKTCDFHQKYSFERCLKKIKEKKRARLKWRIIFWAFLVIIFLGLILTILTITSFAAWHKMSGYEQTGTVLFLIGCITALSVIVWVIKDNEKTAQKWIKEYEKEKAEWKKIK